MTNWMKLNIICLNETKLEQPDQEVVKDGEVMIQEYEPKNTEAGE